MNSFILLEDIELYAYHGVLPQENTVGNLYLVNLKVELDLLPACQSDSIDQTVSYADLYQLVKEEMAIVSKLIEHVAWRIISHIRRRYPQIGSIELKLSKRNPPMGGQLAYASVLIIDNKE